MERKEKLTLREAAQVLASELRTLDQAERVLIRAIEHGELQANIKRWGTEQWDGNQLPGNISPKETLIERADLDAWQARGGLKDSAASDSNRLG